MTTPYPTWSCNMSDAAREPLHVRRVALAAPGGGGGGACVRERSRVPGEPRPQGRPASPPRHGASGAMSGLERTDARAVVPTSEGRLRRWGVSLGRVAQVWPRTSPGGRRRDRAGGPAFSLPWWSLSLGACRRDGREGPRFLARLGRCRCPCPRLVGASLQSFSSSGSGVAGGGGGCCTPPDLDTRARARKHHHSRDRLVDHGKNGRVLWSTIQHWSFRPSCSGLSLRVITRMFRASLDTLGRTTSHGSRAGIPDGRVRAIRYDMCGTGVAIPH